MSHWYRIQQPKVFWVPHWPLMLMEVGINITGSGTWWSKILSWNESDPLICTYIKLEADSVCKSLSVCSHLPMHWIWRPWTPSHQPNSPETVCCILPIFLWSFSAVDSIATYLNRELFLDESAWIGTSQSWFKILVRIKILNNQLYEILFRSMEWSCWASTINLKTLESFFGFD